MVTKVRGYYGSVFQGSRGMTQGDPIYPTIFNMLVDVVVRHWVAVMVENAEERSGRGQEDRHPNPLFYAYDGMVASLDPRWIQGALSTLVGLFNRVGLKTSVGKKVLIV